MAVLINLLKNNNNLWKFILYKSDFKYSDGKQLFPKIKGYQLKLLPIVVSNKVQQTKLIVKVDEILSLNNENQLLGSKFQNYLKQKFQLEKLSKKLQNWQDLEFGDFIKELNKAIKANNKNKELNKGLKPLAKKDEFDWLDLFEENKQKAQALQTQIHQTDKEIDAMVYELYGLTEEEIAIVENS